MKLNELRKPQSLGGYLQKTKSGDPREQLGKHTPTARRSPVQSVESVEPHDTLEDILLAGDREEYVDRSFWNEVGDKTFQESRVDGIWEEEGGEMWK